MSEIDNIIEKEYENYEISFALDYDYDYTAYGGEIEYKGITKIELDINNSEICRRGEPVKEKSKRELLIRFAYGKLHQECREELDNRIEEHLNANESEILQENEDEATEYLRD